jgi:hypothetical protein
MNENGAEGNMSYFSGWSINIFHYYRMKARYICYHGCDYFETKNNAIISSLGIVYSGIAAYPRLYPLRKYLFHLSTSIINTK